MVINYGTFLIFAQPILYLFFNFNIGFDDDMWWTCEYLRYEKKWIIVCVTNINIKQYSLLTEHINSDNIDEF